MWNWIEINVCIEFILYWIIKLFNLFEGKGVISIKCNRGGGGGGFDGG